MFKKSFIWLIFLVIILFLLSLKFFNQEAKPNDLAPVLEYKHELINLDHPQANQEVSSPLLIKGFARGYWFFEGDFPVKLYDQSGSLLSLGIAHAETEWMTEEFVNFSAELIFEITEAQTAFLVLEKDNPSGLPEHDDEFRLPLRLLPRSEQSGDGFEEEFSDSDITGVQPGETMNLKVYFSNQNQDQMLICEQPLAVNREIPYTTAPARAVIEELLKGPSPSEAEQGFFTSLNSGVVLQSLSIVDGLARIDFNQELDRQIGGSCHVQAIWAQIAKTLLQFSTVNDVLISIDGRTEDILQP